MPFQALKTKLSGKKSRSNSVEGPIPEITGSGVGYTATSTSTTTTTTSGLPATTAAPVIATVQPVVQEEVFLKPALEAELTRSLDGVTLAEPVLVEQATTAVDGHSIQVINKPTVVREHIYPVEKEEIQPVIYRERVQLEVRQITREEHEQQVHDVVVQRGELPATYRPAVFEGAAMEVTRDIAQPASFIEPVQRQQVVLEPLVVESVRHVEVQEIQPVIVREIVEPTSVLQTRAIHEKIVEAPIIINRETTVVHELGVLQGTRNIATSDVFVQDYINNLQRESILKTELAQSQQVPLASVPLGLAESR